MAEKVSIQKPFQQGVEDSLLDYYDIMVIGRTGMGKSTTVDKLLIAQLLGAQQLGQGDVLPVYDRERRRLVCDDMTMWLISDKEFNLDRVSLRLKNLVFFRSVENSHKEINSSRESNMHIYESTDQCELLSNETTKIRILDVPGFFGKNAAREERNLSQRMEETRKTDLETMRKVLRIKNVHGLNFNRIVYFLPDKGSLKRTSQNLIIEIQIMEKYFGRAIFDSMVVVATLPTEVYDLIEDENKTLFTEANFEQTRKHLQEAIHMVFKCSDVPEPPLIFISLFDTCEAVLHKVQSSHVKQERIQLEFSCCLCTRCGVIVVEEGQGEDKAAHVLHKNRQGSISQDESICHPLMVPKYTKVEKFFGGIAHLVTLRRFVGSWPSFETMDEVCVNCEQSPGSHGCLQVGSAFKVGNWKDEIIVLHSTSAMETYQIKIQEDNGELFAPEAKSPLPPEDAGTLPPEDAPPSHLSPSCNQHGSHHYVYRNENVRFKQTPQSPNFEDQKGT